MQNAVIQQVLQDAWQHHQAHRHQEAERLCRQVLDSAPEHPDALYLMGVVLSESGRADAAVRFLARALQNSQRSPADLAQGYSNLATILFSLWRLEEAADAARQAVKLAPQLAEAHAVLGNLLNLQGHYDEAINAYQHAISLKPTISIAYNNLGLIYLQFKDQLDEAEAAFRNSVELNPNYSGGLCNLAATLQRQGRLDESISLYRKVLAQEPDYSPARSSMLNTMIFHPGMDAQTLWEEHRRFNEVHALPLARLHRPHTNDRSPDRRLRVGYVSGDFRDHVVGRNMLPLFRHHNRQAFEIFCYANAAARDEFTKQIADCADGWRKVNLKSDEEVAALVRADQIDILVDLSLHMSMGRPLLMARKPAPVQITFAGYPGTTGLTAVDYRLTDSYLDPPGEHDRYYSEKSLYLDHSFWCYDPVTDEPPVNSLPAERNGYITFGCLNNFCKINEPLLRLWAQVLRDVPRSRLILLAAEGRHRQRALDLLGSKGVDPDRVEFFKMQPRAKYLELYHRIDIVLDSFPYNGHTTSLDALWMGVPVVTLVGDAVVSRAGWCQLANLKLAELAAANPDTYVRIATTLAADLDRLARLRYTLRGRMKASPLMDQPGFARSIERCYREAWKRLGS